jgi:hypothetical protein
MQIQFISTLQSAGTGAFPKATDNTKYHPPLAPIESATIPTKATEVNATARQVRIYPSPANFRIVRDLPET